MHRFLLPVSLLLLLPLSHPHKTPASPFLLSLCLPLSQSSTCWLCQGRGHQCASAVLWAELSPARAGDLSSERKAAGDLPEQGTWARAAGSFSVVTPSHAIKSQGMQGRPHPWRWLGIGWQLTGEPTSLWEGKELNWLQTGVGIRPCRH